MYRIARPSSAPRGGLQTATAMTYLVVLAATGVTTGVATGCSQVLGFKDPTLEAAKPETDAAIDTPSDTPSDTAPAACVATACPFGCDTATNACRDGKLWIFSTSGAFLGNDFGGADVPPNVRGGADGKCLAAYVATFSARQCNNNRVHAILHVSGTDSLSLMPTKYAIPTNVPVHRAQDDVLVSNNWNDLTDPTKQLRAAATTAATDADGIVWTGANTVSTCANWTSALTADTGTRGFTNRTDVSWLTHDTFRCDRSASLLCTCWSGGQ